MLIALGSVNRAKLAATSAVVARVFSDAEVRPVEVKVDVPAQPIGDEQTQEGAIARARAAIATQGADLGVGLEGGLRETRGGWAQCSWAAVVDSRGELGVGGGCIIQLPPSVVERVLAGEELGPIIDEISGQKDTRHGQGAMGYFTRGLLTRQRVFEDALLCALARWMNPTFGGVTAG